MWLPWVCRGDAGIDINLYVAVLGLPLVTGKMFTYVGDTSVAYTVMSLVEISSTEFVWYK